MLTRSIRRAVIGAGSVTLAVLTLVGCQGPQPAQPAAASQPSEAVDPMTSINTLLPAPEDFADRRVGTSEYPIPAYAKFLKGVRIVLDPGHGGDADKRGFKRGPTGVREAEMNLRVAKYLKAFLDAAGAEVKLTRDADFDLTHQERADVANRWPAHLFISLHHNAVDNKPQVNYTTVWYHADVDYRPSSLDVARYLCEGLWDALALPQLMDVALKSDQLMYPDGFAVLRFSRVTSCLCESSFYTNPDEEQRLRDPLYNLNEAYGVFLGLARYTASGMPSARLIDPADGVVVAPLAGQPDSPLRLTFALDDGLRGRKSWGSQRQMVLSDTITVRVDDQPAAWQFASDSYQLEVALPHGLAAGSHVVEVQFQNKYKNSILEPYFSFELR